MLARVNRRLWCKYAQVAIVFKETKEFMVQDDLKKTKGAEHEDNVRHSCAHLLAQAVLELFPGTLLTIGPTTKVGFFYDFLPPQNFRDEDLPRIEARMRELVKKEYPITGGQVPKTEARKLFAHNKFKLELIDQIPGETVGVYHQGDFFDLCRGGHVDNIRQLQHFQLTSISGSYWRADRAGQPLQRISGIAFADGKAMRGYLADLEEAKKNDHRVLGKQLDLFSFHQESPGAAFFHARGNQVFNGLIEYSRSLQRATYEEIKTPLIMHESLWHTSGHYDNYKEHMYFTQIDEQTHCVRPMNCPSSAMVFKQKMHSYRDLPLRLSEYGLVHRYELSGVLHGLFRVRTFTQDDAHIFCMPAQIEQEVVGVLQLAQRIYARFGFAKVRMALSTKPAKAMGDDAIWEAATAALGRALDSLGIVYQIQAGEGAFYGPKIEMLVEDTMGREWQCGTVQLDFFLPERFDLEYVASDQSRQRPVMVHRAIFGSIERFMGILLEHCKGHLPFWLAPEQVRVLTITDNQADYAHTVAATLTAAGLRVAVDVDGDKINAKIKRAQMSKIPWMLVLGDKEKAEGTVTLRHVDGRQEFALTMAQLQERWEKLLAE